MTHLHTCVFQDSFGVGVDVECSLQWISRKMVAPGGDGAEGWRGYLELAELAAL